MSSFNKLYKLLIKEKSTKADVIVWLQGDRYDRGTKILDCYFNKLAGLILVSGNNLLIGMNKRRGEKNISLSTMVNWLKKKGVHNKNILVDKTSMNTKEQATSVFKLAKKNNWQKIILVGSSYYQPRAFLTFLKAAKLYNWQGKIINQTFFVDPEKVPGGRTKKAKILVVSEQKKIKLYCKDLVSYREAFNYFK